MRALFVASGVCAAMLAVADETYNVNSGDTFKITEARTGDENTTITKMGPGTLQTNVAWPNFTGNLVLESGVMRQNIEGSMMNAAAKLTINPGATFDLGGDVNQSDNLVNADRIVNRFSVDVQGTGYNNTGAIDNTSPNATGNVRQCGAFSHECRFNLLGDTLLRATYRWGLANNATMYLNGWNLDKDGSDMFGVNNSTVYYNGNETVTVKAGTWNSEGGVKYVQDGDGTGAGFVFKNGAKAQFQSASQPFTLPLSMEGGSTLYFHNSGKNQGQVNGPVTLGSGTVYVDANYNNNNHYGTINGQITGSGLLYKQGDGVVTITNPDNDYTGGTTVASGVLAFSNASALPLTGNITQSGNGVLAVDLSGWTGTEFSSLLNYGNLSGMVSLYNDDTTTPVTFSEDVSSDTIGIGKYGAGKVITTGNFTLTSSTIKVSEGEWAINGGSVALPDVADAYIGDRANKDYKGVLSIQNASLSLPIPAANNSASKAFRIGQNANSSGVLVVGEGASVTGRFIIAENQYGNGAIIQNGGEMYLAGGRGNDASLGANGFCYIELNNGVFNVPGFNALAPNPLGRAVMIQNGGTVTNSVRNGIYEGGLMVSRGGRAHYYMCGGEFKAVNHDLEMLRGTGTNPAVGVFTVDDQGYAELNTLKIGTSVNASATYTGMLNLIGGGTLNFYQLYCHDNTTVQNAHVYVNFNGGVMKARRNNNTLFTTASGRTPDAVVAYENDAIIDTNGNTVDFNQPIVAPSGKGISEITLDAPLTGYIGAPYVDITDGDGVGASAVAVFDYESGTVSGVKITSPGMGYTSVPTVKLVGGKPTGSNSMASVNASATIADNVSGGVVKRGAGTLKLSCANTFAGAVTVEQGTLDLANAAAYPNGCDLKMKGGVLSGSVQTTIAAGELTSAGGKVEVGLSVTGVKADAMSANYTVLAKSPAAIASMTVENIADFGDTSKVLLASYEPIPMPGSTSGLDLPKHSWTLRTRAETFVDPATGGTVSGYVLKVFDLKGLWILVR